MLYLALCHKWLPKVTFTEISLWFTPYPYLDPSMIIWILGIVIVSII